MRTLSGTLDAVHPFVPPALVCPDALAAAHAVAGRFPAALSSCVDFECRLGDGADQVDFLVKMDAAGGAIIAGRNPKHEVAPEQRDCAAWARVVDVCDAWTRDDGTLRDSMDHAWLEFDAPPGAHDSVQVPGVFVCYGESPPDGYSHAAWEAHVRRTLPLLLGAPLPRTWAHTLARCIDRLPAHAYIPSVGLMLQRQAQQFRLCVTRLSDHGILTFLDDIGWPGSAADREALRAQLTTLRMARRDCAAPSATMLQFDIGDAVGGRLSIEYAFARGRRQTWGAPERALLAALCDGGLCTPAKRDALLAWPGYEDVRLPHELWPSRQMRWVTHVKLVVEPGRATHAKAYLGVSHSYVRHWRPADAAGRGRLASTSAHAQGG